MWVLVNHENTKNSRSNFENWLQAKHEKLLRNEFDDGNTRIVGSDATAVSYWKVLILLFPPSLSAQGISRKG